MYRILPSIPDGLEKNVGSFLVEAAQNTLSLPISFRQEIHSHLYPALTQFQSKAYTPGNLVIPSHSLTAFIHLIRADPTSAAFSFLTIYSLRHRTLTDHPDFSNHLFGPLFSSSHGIGKLTIPSTVSTPADQTSQGIISLRQQNTSSIPSGTSRKTSRMIGKLENVSKQFGTILMSSILFAHRTRLLSSLSLL